MAFKVGDKVVKINGDPFYESGLLVATVVGSRSNGYELDGLLGWYTEDYIRNVEDYKWESPKVVKPSGGPKRHNYYRETIALNKIKSDGGCAAYYDFPFKDWTTVNDMIEYLSDKQWGKHSWIFKDILKACTRWGAKDGTTHSYDAKKIIYYGARLLMSVTDKTTLRKYLQELLDDKQFKE